jgi:WD40 repeat protein
MNLKFYEMNENMEYELVTVVEEPHQKYIHKIMFSPTQNDIFVTSSNDNKIKIWKSKKNF